MNVTILGSTGSIGANTLQVIAMHPERFQVFALTAQSNLEAMLAQCVSFKPRYAVMRDPDVAAQLEQRLKKLSVDTQVLGGEDALINVASHPEVDTVMACIVGAAGLLPTLAAAEAGKRILLANKEALVMSGALLLAAVEKNGATLLPVDSEHNAIFQCMPPDFRVGYASAAVNRVIITASGGAFRDLPLDQLEQVTPEQACRHPNWVMGPKITVDSASMMNKGLEIIEASFLFGLGQDKLEVVLHPQSIVHSLVEYPDGSLLAQLGQPDMRTPIAVALAWPERIASGVQRLDLIQVGRLDFQPLCLQRYPCLRLAYDALSAGGTAATILNGANEVAVQAFLARKICFTDIPKLLEAVLSKVSSRESDHLSTVLAADQMARDAAYSYIGSHVVAAATRELSVGD